MGECYLCGRRLDVADQPLSRDCGGDCWGCISEIEAEGLHAPLEEYRVNPAKFLGDCGLDQRKEPN